MSINLILFIIITIVLAIMLGIMAWKYYKQKGISGIRKDVYQLFLKMEHDESKTNEQRMDYVVQLARGMLPKVLQPFITDAMLKWTIQKWFDGIKDLLDDGKLNDSEKSSTSGSEE